MTVLTQSSPLILLWLGLVCAGLISLLGILLRLALNPPDLAGAVETMIRRPVRLADLTIMTTIFVILYAIFALILPLPTGGVPEGQVLAHSIAFHWTILACTALILRKRRLRWESLFGHTGIAPAAAGLLLYLAAVPVITLHSTILLSAARLLGAQPAPQPTILLFSRPAPPAFRLYMLLLGCLVAPVAEEIFFRGYLFPLLVRQTTPLGGLIVSSLVFAAAHMHVYSAPSLFVVALACATAYMFTGSLLAAVTVHAAFNTVNIIIATAALSG